MSSHDTDYHHAGKTMHHNYTSSIPNASSNTILPPSTDHTSSYTNPLSYSTETQQPQDSNQRRKRTRATPEQLAILEKTFSVNPSPINRVRVQLSKDLGMSERSIQIWFQNRRAKVKNMAKRSSLMHDETMRMQYYAATAAAAACQAASSQQQHTSPDGTPVSNTDLYYYYYYYYYNQQQQHGLYGPDGTSTALSSHLKSATQSTPPPPPPMPGTTSGGSRPWTALSTPPPSSSSTPISIYQQHQQQQYQRLRMSSSSSVSSNPSSTSAITVDAAGGRIRSHSVGHYPHNPYQRHGSRPGSSEPATGYYHRRHHSPSASPTLSALPTYMWQSSQPSTLMLNPNDMIPEESAAVTAAPSTGYVSDWSSNTATTTNQDTFPLPVSLVQDERTGTPMSMDDYGNNCEDDGANHYPMSVEALQIGTWKRMSLQPQDLECFYDRQLRCMVWRIRDGQQQFKMHIMVNSIEKVQLDSLVERLGWARLSLTVNQPETICFYMEEGGGTDCGGNWTQCCDFTQDRQATTVPTHYIDGPALALRAEWMRLVGQDQHLLDLFQNNMIQPSQQQQQVMVLHQLYHTAHGPHGQSMLNNSTPSRDVTPADVMMVLQQDDGQQSLLSLMENDQDKNQGAQDLHLFQGV